MSGVRFPWRENPGRWLRLRRRMMEAEGWKCRPCGAPARELDHIIPRALAPDLVWSSDNCQPICVSCHIRKTREENKRRTAEQRPFNPWDTLVEEAAALIM